MKNFALASLGSLALAAAANASLVGIAVNESKVGDKCVVDVYTTFSSANDVLLNVYNVKVSIEGGFGTLIHNDFVGGTWAPQFSSNPAMDTFCVIGGEANFGNIRTPIRTGARPVSTRFRFRTTRAGSTATRRTSRARPLRSPW